MQKQQNKSIRNMKNQGNLLSQKEKKNNSPIAELKATEFHDLVHKEFKIPIFEELQ